MQLLTRDKWTSYLTNRESENWPEHKMLLANHSHSHSLMMIYLSRCMVSGPLRIIGWWRVKVFASSLDTKDRWHFSSTLFALTMEHPHQKFPFHLRTRTPGPFMCPSPKFHPPISLHPSVKRFVKRRELPRRSLHLPVSVFQNAMYHL